jgi:uncharacterized protein (TIGR04255 family)
MTDSIEELRLSNSPLARVLCQIRWPKLAWFKTDEVESKLGDAIGSDYPYPETQQEAQFIITPQGVTPQQGDKLYKWVSADRNWTVTMGSTFLSLETVAYGEHEDFIERLGQAFDALLAVAPIPGVVRVGYRYTNRITNADDLANLGSYFQAGILGAIASGEPQGLVHSVSESVYGEDGGFLLVRTALLGPNASVDPSLPPADKKSWVLDLDAYVESPPPGLAPTDVRALAQAQADRARKHFRELITNEFKDRFR